MAFKKEIEVKFRLNDKREMQKKLMGLGGTIVSLRFQRDIRAKQPPDSTSLQNVFPRVRESNGKSIMTVKVKNAPAQGFFERDEYEFGVDDSQTALRALAAMGFTDQRALEKYRQTWRIGESDLEVVIDSLPFGDYMEIEGGIEAIEALARDLGLDNADRVTDAYLVEYAKRCKIEGVDERQHVCFMA